jgi:oligopeptide/dipeptide ABC transporter ATP-binding protein
VNVDPTTIPLVEASDLRVCFELRDTGRLFPRKLQLHAVDGVSFQIGHSETLAIVGESGSGKSTTGRALMRLVPVAGGSVRLNGVEMLRGAESERTLRRQMQMVFQDPYSSLDPSMTVGRSVREPLDVHTPELSKREREERVHELLELVGLSSRHASRYPFEFSGGQRQRLAIARAIASRPQVVVCDEAVSALDVSTQNQVINMLEDLQDQFGISYLFISHDLSVVRHIAHRVAVMYLGRFVETGPTERVFESPTHPYTQALISAAPIPDPDRQNERARIVLEGDIPDPIDPPSGCRFHTRCPFAMEICSTEPPPEVEAVGGGTTSCHLHTSGPMLRGRSVLELDTAPAAVTHIRTDHITTTRPS